MMDITEATTYRSGFVRALAKFKWPTGLAARREVAVAVTVQAVTVLQQLDALAAEGPPVVGQGEAATIQPGETAELRIYRAPGPNLVAVNRQ